MIKINDENAQLTKKDWAEIKTIYKNRQFIDNDETFGLNKIIDVCDS